MEGVRSTYGNSGLAMTRNRAGSWQTSPEARRKKKAAGCKQPCGSFREASDEAREEGLANKEAGEAACHARHGLGRLCLQPSDLLSGVMLTKVLGEVEIVWLEGARHPTWNLNLIGPIDAELPQDCSHVGSANAYFGRYLNASASTFVQLNDGLSADRLPRILGISVIFDVFANSRFANADGATNFAQAFACMAQAHDYAAPLSYFLVGPTWHINHLAQYGCGLGSCAGSIARPISALASRPPHRTLRTYESQDLRDGLELDGLAVAQALDELAVSNSDLAEVRWAKARIGEVPLNMGQEISVGHGP